MTLSVSLNVIEVSRSIVCKPKAVNGNKGVNETEKKCLPKGDSSSQKDHQKRLHRTKSRQSIQQKGRMEEIGMFEGPTTRKGSGTLVSEGLASSVTYFARLI